MPDQSFTIVASGVGMMTPGHCAQLDAIFFGASGRTLPPGPERDAFRERWLGRYLQGGTDVVLLAFDASQALAGYLVGALDDPARQSRFDDIPYFRREFRDFCRSYPAHLHINLAPACRSRGLGARLIEAFAAHAAEAGAPGMHVVTGKELRNVRFYKRCGFSEQAVARWNHGDIVFLGRQLPAQT
jgi:GNAT superfamily N-acetyltransferase